MWPTSILSVSLKRLIVGSPVEGPARRAFQWLTTEPLTPAEKKNLAYDKQTVEVMRRCLKPDSNCVDIGCHSGSLLRPMLQFSPLGVHYAFEPIPELYRSLVEKFPSVKVFDFALSDVHGQSSFQHVVSDPAYSGLKRRPYKTNHEAIEEITVRTETLDAIIQGSVDLMKIDVEGGELQVLKGAEQTIRRCRPTIIFEHGLGPARCYGTTPDQVFDLLTGCGLSVFVMRDWLRGRQALKRLEFSAQLYSGTNFYFMASQSNSSSESQLEESTKKPNSLPPGNEGSVPTLEGSQSRLTT